MLFLLNDRMLDLGVPAETLAQRGFADPRRPASMREIVTRGQEAAFASDNFVHAHPDLALSLAVQIAVTSEANCALFVRPPKARRPREVGVQFAYAPLITMALLLDAQQAGRLTAGLINGQVWSLAHAAAPA